MNSIPCLNGSEDSSANLAEDQIDHLADSAAGSLDSIAPLKMKIIKTKEVSSMVQPSNGQIEANSLKTQMEMEHHRTGRVYFKNMCQSSPLQQVDKNKSRFLCITVTRLKESEAFVPVCLSRNDFIN